MNFSEHEQKGRDKYERNCTIPHEYTKGKYAPWDVSATSDTSTFNIEIKDRDISYLKYASVGFWFEKTKYDPLMEAYRLTGSKPIFLVYLQDGIGIWWDLSELDSSKIKWEKRWATKTTANGTYGQEKEEKTVMFLFPKYGHKFNYE